MGTSEGVTSLMLATEIGSLIEDVHRLQEMSRCAGQLMQIGYPKNGVNLFDAIMEINDART
jgi:hypothetical protein